MHNVMHFELRLITCGDIFYPDYSCCGICNNVIPWNLDSAVTGGGGRGAVWGGTQGNDEDLAQVSLHGRVKTSIFLWTCEDKYLSMDVLAP